MLAPWQSEAPEEMSRSELDRRASRTLSDEDLATLAALGIALRTKRGRYQVAVSQLTVGLGLLDLGFPTEAAIAASDVYAEHGRQIAKELNELFRTMVWPVYKESGASPEQAARGRRAAQAAVDRVAGRRLRVGHGRDQPRGRRQALALTSSGEAPVGLRRPRVGPWVSRRRSW